jgi:hypothetical protein
MVGSGRKSRTACRPSFAQTAAVARQWLDLAGPFGDDRVAIAGECIGDDVFELADFVATDFEAGEIVALEPQIGPAKFRGQSVEWRQRRGKLGQFQALRLLLIDVEHERSPVIRRLGQRWPAASG